MEFVKGYASYFIFLSKLSARVLRMSLEKCILPKKTNLVPRALSPLGSGGGDKALGTRLEENRAT